jgi:hypothetical protein
MFFKPMTYDLTEYIRKLTEFNKTKKYPMEKIIEIKLLISISIC